MNRLFGILIAALLSGSIGASARPYFNDQKAPQSLDDLRNIQNAVQQNLEAARAATVCVKLKNGTGTGVIISPEGLVLTAAHVSTGVGVNLTLIAEDGTEMKAQSLGLNSENDAAMVQITGKGPFPYVKYNTQSDYQLGDWVFALGHSGGFDEERGVVARVGRLTKLSPDTIQSGCLLIGGDSGGPLFDMDGTLIGIHSRVGKIKDDSRHVPLEAFARSWEKMQAGEFIGQGPFAQPKMPVSSIDFLGMMTEFDEQEKKLMIREVEVEGLAEQAGLKPGMQIIEVNGKVVEESDLLMEMMKEKSRGEKLSIKWKHEGESGEAVIALEEKE